MKKNILLAFCFSLFAFSSYAQQQPRYNPDTIRTIVIDSAVNIRSHRLNAQDFIDAVLSDTGLQQCIKEREEKKNELALKGEDPLAIFVSQCRPEKLHWTPFFVSKKIAKAHGAQ